MSNGIEINRRYNSEINDNLTLPGDKALFFATE
jgi:hypothetical protein